MEEEEGVEAEGVAGWVHVGSSPVPRGLLPHPLGTWRLMVLPVVLPLVLLQVQESLESLVQVLSEG